MKTKTIRFTIDIDIAADAPAPFGATSHDQEHTYYTAALAELERGAARMFQTRTAGARFVKSTLLEAGK